MLQPLEAYQYDRSRIQDKLDHTKQWLDNWRRIGMEAVEDGVLTPAQQETMMWPRTAFLEKCVQYTSELPNRTNQEFLIGGEPFTINPLDERSQFISFMVLPSDSKGPIDSSVHRHMARTYDHALEEFLRSSNVNRLPFVSYSVFPPHHWTFEGKPSGITYWVGNQGPGIFVMPEGVDGLVGRFDEGHPDHEGTHRFWDLTAPELVVRFLYTYRSIGESIPETMAILRHINDSSYPYHIQEGQPLALPRSNAIRNFLKLTVNDLLSPLPFNELDSKGAYNHELYAQRLPLAVMIAVLMKAMEYDARYPNAELFQGSPDTVAINLLNRGLNNTYNKDHYWYIEFLHSISQQLNRVAKKREPITPDMFWKTFFQGKQMSFEPNEQWIENIFRRSARLVTLLFMLEYENAPLQLLNSLHPLIRESINKHVPSLGTISKLQSYDSVRRNNPPLIQSLPELP